MDLPSPDWPLVAETAHTMIYEYDPHTLVAVPHEGVSDTEDTARECINAQASYFREHGRVGGTIVLMDRLGDQTAQARAVYQNEGDTDYLKGFALVGGTTFGRAVGSVFIGIARPSVPTKLFANFESAVQWLAEKVDPLVAPRG